MIHIKHNNILKHPNKIIRNIALPCLLAATLTAAAADECPEHLKDVSIWEKTQQLSISGFESAKALSSEAWDDSLAFFDKDDNASLATIAATGTTSAIIGASAVSSTSIGIITISTMPAWGPVALFAGGAISIAAATQLIMENIDE